MDEISWQEDYELVRDTIIKELDPPDDDIAEPAIMAQAVEDAAAELKALRDVVRHVLDLDADGVIALPPDSLLRLQPWEDAPEDDQGGYNPDGYILNPNRKYL